MCRERAENVHTNLAQNSHTKFVQNALQTSSLSVSGGFLFLSGSSCVCVLDREELYFRAEVCQPLCFMIRRRARITTKQEEEEEEGQRNDKNTTGAISWPSTFDGQWPVRQRVAGTSAAEAAADEPRRQRAAHVN